MIVKFKPSAFAAFDGIKKTCVKFEKAKGGVLRCAKFRKGRGSPVCDSRLVDGGRSPGLVRKVHCRNGPSKSQINPHLRRKTRKHRKHRRSRRK
jgi:hypothetical protein